MKSKTVYENEYIEVTETGRPYDFVATILNKSDTKIKINFTGNYEDLETIELDKSGTEYDWCGLFNNQWWATMENPDISHSMAFIDNEIEIEEV